VKLWERKLDRKSLVEGRKRHSVQGEDDLVLLPKGHGKKGTRGRKGTQQVKIFKF